MATSHRIVAGEPVTERFGPRSTPTSSAPVACAGNCAELATVAAMSPMGGFLMRFDPKATAVPPSSAAVAGAFRASSEEKRVSELRPGVLDTLSENEEPGDERQNTPGDLAEHGPR